MTVNFTNEIIFLKDGKELSDLCHEGIVEACKLIREVNNAANIKPETIRTRHTRLGFIKYFDPIYHDEIGQVTQETIAQWLDLLGCSQTNLPHDASLLIRACQYEDDDLRPEPTRNYFRGVKYGLQLTLLYLWAHRALILPYRFCAPHTGIEAPYLSRKILIPFYTETSWMARSINTACSEKIKLPNDTPQKLYDFYSGLWWKLILSTTWNSPEDISAQDLIDIHIANIHARRGSNKYITSSLSISLLNAVLHEQFEEKLSFDKEDVSQRLALSTQEKRRENILNTAPFEGNITLENIFDNRFEQRHAYNSLTQIKNLYTLEAHASDETIIAILKDIAWSTLTEDKQLDFIASDPDLLPVEATNAYKYWHKLFTIYVDSIRRENYKACTIQFGLFVCYLVFYLSWWFKQHNTEEKLTYPTTASELIGAIYISRPAMIEGQYPMDYASFHRAMGAKADWAGNTSYGYMKQLEKIFQWIEKKSDVLPDCKGFTNALSGSDFEQTTRYGQTNKTPIPRRLFNPLVSYVYALEKFQLHLIEGIESGRIEPHQFKGMGACWLKPADFGIELECQLGDESLPIKNVPQFFYVDKHKFLSNGMLETQENLNPAELRICLLMLETGIRANHIKWLDLHQYDSLARTDSNLSLQPLMVNTDKAKKHPWLATVSSRVIDLCNRQRKWREKVQDEGFQQEAYYNNNPKSKFGKFVPLFSAQENGSPRAAGYDDTWLQIMRGFEHFLREHQLDDYALYGYKPVGSKIKYGDYIQPTPIPIEDELPDNLNIDGPHTKIILGCRHTPHSARVSVVSNDITLIPARVIGKHRTGQSEGVVYYYAVIDEDTVRATQQAQWDEFSEHLQEDLMNDELQQKAMIKANKMNSNLANDIKADPNMAIEAYGLMTLEICTEEQTEATIDKSKKTKPKDGLALLRQKQSQSLAFNTTHICPFNNICAKEIVHRFNRLQPCAVCPYAIKGVEHIPAIAAAAASSRERAAEAEKKLRTLRSGGDKSIEETTQLEAEQDWLLMESLGWEYAEQKLYDKAQTLKGEFEKGIYDVDEPQFIANRIEKFEIQDKNDPEYLIKRLRECQAYPTLDSPTIRAKFDIARRRLLATTGNMEEAFSLEQSTDSAKELYALIQSYMNTYQLPPASVFGLLRTSPTEMIQSLPNRQPMLAMTLEDQ